MNRMRAKLAKYDCMINAYGDAWVLLENLNFPNYFIYLEIGDWIKPHTGTIYKKINCFEKTQLTYEKALGCGEDIKQLLDFAKNPVFENYTKGTQCVYLSKLYNYLTNLYTVCANGETNWQTLMSELTNTEQRLIIETLQHIEMRQTETRRLTEADNKVNTVLRFMNDTAYFDYDCDDRKIIGSGPVPLRNNVSKSASENDIDVFGVLDHDEKFRYQLLSRMQADCDYYLDGGCGQTKHLWAQSETAQINTMRLLHNSFPGDKKPEWLTLAQIDDYETKILTGGHPR